MACPDAYVDTSNSAESPYFSYPILGVENPRHFYACYRKDMYLTKYMKGFLEVLHALRNPAKTLNGFCTESPYFQNLRFLWNIFIE